jgi:hypothetical protein
LPPPDSTAKKENSARREKKTQRTPTLTKLEAIFFDPVLNFVTNSDVIHDLESEKFIDVVLPKD